MPTKANMRLDVAVVVLTLMTATLVRLWAARHSAQNDRLTVLADAANTFI